MHDGRIEALFTIPTGGATMSVTNTGGGPTTVTIPAGDYYLTAAGSITGLLATLKAQLDATRPPSSGSWTVALSTGANGTLRVTITCTGAWSITWTGSEGDNLAAILGWGGDISGSGAITSDNQARGVWGPDCPLDLAGDPRMAPIATDARRLVSPTGGVIGLVGNTRYEHKQLVYSHIPSNRYREALTTYDGASLEQFLADTQWGLDHSWFVPNAMVQIYDHTGAALGSDEGVDGWFMHGVDELPTTKSVQSYTGLWRWEISKLTTSG